MSDDRPAVYQTFVCDPYAYVSYVVPDNVTDSTDSTDTPEAAERETQQGKE